MRNLVTIAALVASLSMPAVAAPLLSDMADVPACPAVESLVKAGVIEGYPDGTFKGGRAATRFEVAQLVARLAAREQQAHASLASRRELDELTDMVKQLLQGTGDLEGRTSALEERVKALYARGREAR